MLGTGLRKPGGFSALRPTIGENSSLCFGAVKIHPLTAFRSQQVFFFNFSKNKNLWSYGDLAGDAINGSIPVDPWSNTGNANTPFDQDFFLILNVAVGGTNGWFP